MNEMKQIGFVKSFLEFFSSFIFSSLSALTDNSKKKTHSNITYVNGLNEILFVHQNVIVLPNELRKMSRKFNFSFQCLLSLLLLLLFLLSFTLRKIYYLFSQSQNRKGKIFIEKSMMCKALCPLKHFRLKMFSTLRCEIVC